VRPHTGALLSRLGLPPADVEAEWSRASHPGGHRGGAWFDRGRRSTTSA